MTGTQLETLSLIKPNALNKGRARTWVESRELAKYGFSRHAPITVEFGADSIVVRLDDNGKRKVAGRPDKQILDLCEPVAARDARWGSAVKLRVSIAYGLIVIKGIF